MKKEFNFSLSNLARYVLLLVALTLNACGGGGSGAGSDAVTSVMVSTVAGSNISASADGTGAAASFNFMNGATTVGGYIYVVDVNNHNIRKINIATGVVTTFAGTTGLDGSTDATGTAASFSLPFGITNDGANLYVTDRGNNKIRKIVIATGVVTTLAGSGATGTTDGTGTAATFNQPVGITTDNTNLYVSELGSNNIRKIVISSGAVTLLAGSGTAGNVDASGPAASFSMPYDLAYDSNGSVLYVADSSNNKIRQIDIASTAVTTLAGSVSGLSGFVNATGTAAKFSTPAGLSLLGGDLYVTEWNNHAVRKIAISSKVVTPVAGTGGSGAIDAIGAAASFNLPHGIANDGTNLYVVDEGNRKIRKIVISSYAVTTLAGSEARSAIDAIGTAATFFDPAGIVSDGTNLYVADESNHKIRKIEISSGTVTTFAGTGSYGAVDATGVAASFGRPYGLVIEGGNLYVTDRGVQNIRKIVLSTQVVSTLAGGSIGTYGSTDAIGPAALFNYPSGITSDSTNLYVADEGNNKIRKIVIATKAVTTFAGTGIAGATDAAGILAAFKAPSGITTDGSNLYVSDTGNHKIRKIVISSKEVTTFSGTSLLYPTGIVTDGTNLFVADTGNHKIRKIVIGSGAFSTWAGTGSAGVVDGAGTVASFFYPVGITSAGSNLFVTDASGQTIRKIQ